MGRAAAKAWGRLTCGIGVLGGRLNPSSRSTARFESTCSTSKTWRPAYRRHGRRASTSRSARCSTSGSNTAEFVARTEAGFFGRRRRPARRHVPGIRLSASGLAAGFNTGMFFAVSPSTSLGGMLSSTVRDASTACYQAPGYTEVCIDRRLHRIEKVLGFNAARCSRCRGGRRGFANAHPAADDREQRRQRQRQRHRQRSPDRRDPDEAAAGRVVQQPRRRNAPVADDDVLRRRLQRHVAGALVAARHARRQRAHADVADRHRRP